MSLTIKAYYKRSEKAEPEIRRFIIDHDVTSNYEYLVKKVAMAFPCLDSNRPEKLQLAWKDSEGDMITFSTDDELVDALGLLDENLLKIYVTERKKKAQGSAADAEGDVFHPGVICDGCEGSIRGPRFKCLMCPDYDLCKDCEEKGLHAEHEFVKFRKPGIGRTQTGGFKWNPNIWRGFGHPGWRHWWWQQRNQGSGPCGPRGGPCGPRGGPRCWGPGQTTEEKSEGGPRCWGPGQTTGEKSEGQEQQQQQQQQQQSGCGQGRFPSEEEGRDFMQHIGEQVAEMLDPLGIDVDIETSIGGMRRKCHDGPGGNRRGNRHGNGRGNGCGNGRGKGKGKCRGNGNNSGNADEKEDDTTSNMETAAGEEKQNGETSQAAAAADSMETESGPSAKTGGASGGSDDGDEWTMVTEGNDGDKANDGDKEEDDKQSSQAPPHITDAMDQLKSMGFDDDGGWLTHLVEAKGGDINRILDTIRLNTNK